MIQFLKYCQDRTIVEKLDTFPAYEPKRPFHSLLEQMKTEEAKQPEETNEIGIWIFTESRYLNKT